MAAAVRVADGGGHQSSLSYGKACRIADAGAPGGSRAPASPSPISPAITATFAIAGAT
jgi:hypothetical protein